MPQQATVAVSYTDDEGLHAGFVTIDIPSNGDPADAGTELLNMGISEETASLLRGQNPTAHSRFTYTQVMRDAQKRGTTHLYRLDPGGWEYQHIPTMFRGFPMNPDNIEQYKQDHQVRMSNTASSQTVLPPEMRGETRPEMP